MSSLFEIYQGKRLQRKVRAIVSNERGEFLLIQPHSYKDNSWTFVGGGMEPGESPEQAIRREMKEEVGIDDILSLRTSLIRPWYEFSPKFIKAKKNIYDGQIASLFWIEVSNDILIKLQAEEVKAFRWATIDEARQLVTVPEQLEWFNAFVDERTFGRAA